MALKCRPARGGADVYVFRSNLPHESIHVTVVIVSWQSAVAAAVHTGALASVHAPVHTFFHGCSGLWFLISRIYTSLYPQTYGYMQAKSASSFVRVTGTCIGGGTVLGLARLLFHAKSFRQVVRLSERGNVTFAIMLPGVDLAS